MKQPDVWFLPTKRPVPLPLRVFLILVSTSTIIFIIVGYMHQLDELFDEPI